MFKLKRWILFNDLLIHCKRKRVIKKTGEIKKCKVSQYLMLADVRVEVVVEPIFFLEEEKAEGDGEKEKQMSNSASSMPAKEAATNSNSLCYSFDVPLTSAEGQDSEDQESEKKGGYYGCRVRGPGIRELFIFCESEATRDEWCSTVQKYSEEARGVLTKRNQGRGHSPQPTRASQQGEFTTPQSLWALTAESTEKGGPRLRRMLSVTTIGGSEKKMSSKQLKRVISSGKYLSKRDDDGFWNSLEKDGPHSHSSPSAGSSGKPGEAPRIPLLEVNDPRNRRKSVGGKAWENMFGKGSKTERESERETQTKVMNPLLSDRSQIQTPGRGSGGDRAISPMKGEGTRRRKKAKRTLMSRDDL